MLQNKTLSIWATSILTIVMGGVLIITALPILCVAAPPPPYNGMHMNSCWIPGTCLSFAVVGTNLTAFLHGSAMIVCLAVFVAGAFIMTISGGQETMVQTGKGMMRGSAIGLAVVFGSYSIYRTVAFFLGA